MAKKKPSVRKPAAKSKKPKAAKAVLKSKKSGSKARTALKKKPVRKSAVPKNKPASRNSKALRKKPPAKKPAITRKKAPSRKPILPAEILPPEVVVEEVVVTETTFLPAASTVKIHIQVPVLSFLGTANVNRNTGTICARGSAADQFGQGPTQVWAEVFANNPEPIPPGAPPDAGAIQGTESGRNFTVDPVPNAACAEPPNPPIMQYIVIWVQMPDGSWSHQTQPFAAQCADTNDCGD